MGVCFIESKLMNPLQKGLKHEEDEVNKGLEPEGHENTKVVLRGFPSCSFVTVVVKWFLQLLH